MVTRNDVARMIAQYLRGDMTLRGLVDWAEQLFVDEPFEEGHERKIAEVVSYLAGADMPDMFPLTPQVLHGLLKQIDYQLELEPVTAA